MEDTTVSKVLAKFNTSDRFNKNTTSVTFIIGVFIYFLIQRDPNISPSSSSHVKGSVRKETIGCDVSETQPSNQESGTGNAFTPVEKFECKIYKECVF